MTEEEWLTGTDLAARLNLLRGRISDRKLRLFAVACCRAVWVSLPCRRSQQAVEVAERFADGAATEQDLSRHYEQAWEASSRYRLNTFGTRSFEQRRLSIPELRMGLASQTAHLHRPFLIGRLAWLHRDDELRTVGGGLLHCIAGNPFRPVTFSPAWRTSTVSNLAAAIYEERQLPSGLFDSQRPGILADALEETGCDNADILGHLRGGGEHVRGCWAIDLVLGKE